VCYLGRVAQMLSTGLLKQLQAFGKTPGGSQTPTSTQATTTQTPNTLSALPSTQIGACEEDEAISLNPDQQVIYVLSELVKISTEQRPKTIQKLENLIMGYLKKLSRFHKSTDEGASSGNNSINNNSGRVSYVRINDIVNELVARNKVFVDHTKVLYLF
jgi:hypothetical protein